MTDLTPNIAREEERLRSEKDEAYKAVIRRPTTANRKAYAAAEKALAEYQQAIADPETVQTITGKRNVLEYLQADNWKIEKTKLYQDVKEGKLRAEPSGHYSLAVVLEYARLWLQKLDGTPGTIAALPSLQEQKILEEVGRIRADRLTREINLKEKTGELIRKSEVEIEHAKRIIYLRSDLKNVFRAGAVEIIRQVGGDPQKAPALIAYGVGLIDAAMDRYARAIRLDGEE